MVRWERGRQHVEALIGAGQLQKVVGSGDATAVLLDMAADHVVAAKACIKVDPAGALSLAYDAARKAATAVLAHQGLRPTTKGGHIAATDAITVAEAAIRSVRTLIDRPEVGVFR